MGGQFRFRFVCVPLLAVTGVTAAYYVIEGCPSGELVGIWLPWLAIMLAAATAFFALFRLGYLTRRPLLWATAVGALAGTGPIALYKVAFFATGDPLCRLSVGVVAVFSVLYVCALLHKGCPPKNATQVGVAG